MTSFPFDLAPNRFPRSPRTTLFLIATAVSALVHAAPPVTARVTYAGVYGNGDVYVGLDTTIQEPNCPGARFDIPASSPVAKQVLATAQMALATGHSVTVQTDGCFGSFTTLNSSARFNSYFFINN
jgi:hypothetical protein